MKEFSVNICGLTAWELMIVVFLFFPFKATHPTFRKSRPFSTLLIRYPIPLFFSNIAHLFCVHFFASQFPARDRHRLLSHRTAALRRRFARAQHRVARTIGRVAIVASCHCCCLVVIIVSCVVIKIIFILFIVIKIRLLLWLCRLVRIRAAAPAAIRVVRF